MKKSIVLIGLLVAASPAAAQTEDSLPLSLEEAVGRALEQGDEVLLARAQVELADAQVTSARAGGLPQLRLSSTYNHVFENARANAVGQIFNQPNSYNTNANLSQSIFQGGRIFAGARAASRLRNAARLTAEETRNQAVFEVQRAYLQALFAQQLADIQDANLNLADAQLRQVAQFEASGRAARYDVLRARVERANIEPQAIQARSDLDIALLELKRLTNVPAATPLKLTTQLTPENVQATVVGMLQQETAVEDRPSVQAARFVAQARKDAVRVARADWLPTINVFVQSGYQAFPTADVFPWERGRLAPEFCPEGSTATRCQNGGWFPDRSMGVQLSWPLFDGLRAKGNIDAAQAQARIAELQWAQEREAVALEIEQARANFERAQALFAARRENATEANEAFRLVTLRYNRGLSTQLDVSDTQIALMTARTNEARAVYDLYLAGAELARAQGKSMPLPAPVTPAPQRTETR
ncbi:MAG TPA: TolC family protein [Longimicrobiales bacterium]|nr:TolC family protein [Longimicrobiales bacterium]